RPHASFDLFPYTTLFRSPPSDVRLVGRYPRRQADGAARLVRVAPEVPDPVAAHRNGAHRVAAYQRLDRGARLGRKGGDVEQRNRSEEHTSELQSRENLVC